VFAQAVLGRLTVEFDLKPGFVMAHFLVSIVLLTNTIWLYWRAGQPDGASGETRSSARIVT
jgi:cytochrome c oxidase assembly protein subunit 15